VTIRALDGDYSSTLLRVKVSIEGSEPAIWRLLEVGSSLTLPKSSAPFIPHQLVVTVNFDDPRHEVRNRHYSAIPNQQSHRSAPAESDVAGHDPEATSAAPGSPVAPPSTKLPRQVPAHQDNLELLG
jgi:hypothetical protein